MWKVPNALLAAQALFFGRGCDGKPCDHARIRILTLACAPGADPRRVDSGHQPGLGGGVGY